MAKGNKPGAITRGSMVWHVSRLALGECLLVADKPGYANYQAAIVLTIDRARRSGALAGNFTVRACVGHRCDMSKLPFRFFEITREG